MIEYIQVGRNCLADFLSGHDALLYAERAQYLADINSLGESMEDEFGFGGGPSYSALEEYLAHVAECIRMDGWMSRGKARELDMEGFATCDVAERHYKPRLRPNNFKPMYDNPTEQSVKVAEDAIEWAANIEGEDISEYLHNIRTIARRMVYESRDIGLAASIVSAYQKHLSEIRYKELQANRRDIAQHVGQVGERICVKVIIDKVIQVDSMYGTSHLHIMSDQNTGNVFVWFSSSGAIETGSEITLKGTIKAHSERDGIKQNQLTRCERVTMKKWFAVTSDGVHYFDSVTESEVRKMLREKLAVKKLPQGIRIIEDICV